MEQKIQQADYIQAVKAIKEAIQETRYRTAKLVNKELLALYYAIGKYISANSRNATWGSGAIAAISRSLQEELPGLRGFSEVNIKRMRTFYEAWSKTFEENRPLPTDEIILLKQTDDIEIRPLMTDELTGGTMEAFLNIGFTHHYEIILKAQTLDDRLFFIKRCAEEFWNVETLKYWLKEGRDKLPATATNFGMTISDDKFRQKAIAAFREEYNLPFVEINDDNDFPEKQLELSIINNIKKFLLALGTGFTFIGNQYRLVVDGQEYFIDLLFYNRQLRSLVCFELKYGAFKPEYAGKLNFYLSALDEYVKLPDENPSIGIILCRSKSDKVVSLPSATPQSRWAWLPTRRLANCRQNTRMFFQVKKTSENLWNKPKIQISDF